MTWNVALETGGVVVSKKIRIEIESEAVLRRPEPAARSAPHRTTDAPGNARGVVVSVRRRSEQPVACGPLPVASDCPPTSRPVDVPLLRSRPAHGADRARDQPPTSTWRSSPRARRRASCSARRGPTVKREWGHESIGWYDDADALVGAGLVLLRQVPKVKRFLAYLPEGPVLDWATDDLGAWLTPMVEHLRERGAFGVRMGPPVALRRWSAATVKAAIADGSAKRLTDVPPDVDEPIGDRVVDALTALGWQRARRRRRVLGAGSRRSSSRCRSPAGRRTSC